MLNLKKIEAFAEKMADNLPQGIKNISNDAEKTFKHIIQLQLEKLDLVSREDFELKVKELSILKDKVCRLEQQMLWLQKNTKNDQETIPNNT